MQSENYITIQGWMRNELNLKGNELMVYALIYGFSQDGENQFTGSVGYIAEWIGTSKQTVHNVLKALIDKNCISKSEKIINGVKFCRYQAILPPVKNFDRVVKKFDGGSQKILPNNIEYKDSNNIDTIGQKKEIDATIVMVIDHMNEVCGTKYRANNKETQRCINARIRDGYVLQDFYTVIDKKASEWIGTEFEKYLRPKTLFGTKFESYLNAKVNSGNPFIDILKGVAQ